MTLLILLTRELSQSIGLTDWSHSLLRIVTRGEGLDVFD